MHTDVLNAYKKQKKEHTHTLTCTLDRKYFFFFVSAVSSYEYSSKY